MSVIFIEKKLNPILLSYSNETNSRASYIYIVLI